MKLCVYSYQEEVEHGPLDPEKVIEMLYGGVLQWNDAIREEGSGEWQTMEEVFDLELLDGAGSA